MKRWVCGLPLESGDVHVWPADQGDIHNLDGRGCICGPRLVDEPGMLGRVVVHRDLRA